jgi:zinc protease
LVANFIFGGDMSSRINERLRIQEGLTYGAFSWFSNGRSCGPFCISAQVNPENVEPAIAAAKEELARYANEGVSEDELTLTVDYLTGNFPVSLSTNSAVAAILTESVYLDKGVEYLWHYPEIIKGVTAGEVQAIAKEIMGPSNLLLVVSGSLTDS